MREMKVFAYTFAIGTVLLTIALIMMTYDISERDSLIEAQQGYMDHYSSENMHQHNEIVRLNKLIDRCLPDHQK